MAKSTSFHTTKCSIFASRLLSFKPDCNYSVKISLTEYYKRKFITRKQAVTLIKKKWLAIMKSKGKLYVEEICPEMIKEWLT